MAAQTTRSSDLTDEEKASIIQSLDAILNSEILYSFLYGIYTGIVGITLWIIFHERRLIRRYTVITIILLHALTTLNFTVTWSYIHSSFTENGQSFRSVYSRLGDPAYAVFWEAGVTATLGTVLSDLYMIWCCWTVWGRRRLFVLFPILSLICAIALKFVEGYHAHFNTSYEIFLQLYISFLLMTTLWCTSLVICRIVVRVRDGADSRWRVYQRLIAVLVESSALYSISLIVYLALTVHKDSRMYYLDGIAAVAKGVAPTLLVAQCVAGHTRPRYNRDESTVSTLRFQTPSEHCTSNFRESTMQSAVFDIDIEAEAEQIVWFSLERDRTVHNESD